MQELIKWMRLFQHKKRTTSMQWVGSDGMLSVRLRYRKTKIHARNLPCSRTGTTLAEGSRSSCVSPSHADSCPPGQENSPKNATSISCDNFHHVNTVNAFQLRSGSAEYKIAHIIYLIINHRIRNSPTNVSTGIS